MLVWLATLIAVAVGANDVFAPETADASDSTATNLVDPQHTNLVDSQHSNLVDPQHTNLVDPQHTNLVDPQHTNLVDSQHSNLVDPQHTNLVDSQHSNLVDPQHHRVHNLVLNPEQHSLCELKPIRQIITHAHCVSKEIENNVCVGTCFSYSVPQTDPETPGDELLDYCDSCQASESHWTTLELNCEEYGSAYPVPKRIQMITNCSCSPCHPSRVTPITTNEVTIHNNDHHVSELIYKMLPDSHRFKEGGGVATAAAPPAASAPQREDNTISRERELKYTEVSLGDLKKEFNLDPHQETLLQGRVLFKDSASFIDTDEEEDPRHLNY